MPRTPPGTPDARAGAAWAMSRRTFLALGAGAAASACTPGADDRGEPGRATPSAGAASPPTAGTSTAATTATSSTTTSTVLPLAADPFTLGVGSGDPDATSVVLWTRLTGDLPEEVEVAWEVGGADDPLKVVAAGTTTARAADGHSVHVAVDVGGPSWYRFRAGGFTSAVGRAAPATGGQLRLATASCQSWPDGYYAAHRDLAEWAPDVVVFLGDFIYEQAAEPLGGGRVRAHDGPEPADVAGYRSRYALYLSDADLQAARAACPWIVAWDDHEVDNNYAALVSEDLADPAAFAVRRGAAYKAWWEHTPTRLPAPVAGEDYPTYRAVAFGDLVELAVLDGRQYRSDQACGDAVLQTAPACPEALDPARTMLGAAQEAWVAERLAASTATWTVLGQQTVLTDLRLPNGAILNHDQWDGYAPARDRLLASAAGVRRLVVLTGDIHLAGVATVPGLGAEFVTTSVSSPGNVPADLEPVLAGFPTVVGAELAHRGYTRHTVTPASWEAEYRIVADVGDPASAVSTWRTFTVDAAMPDVVTVR